MKKGEIVEVKIEGINIRGKSYGYISDDKVYVNINAARDQIVRGQISKTRKGKYELTKCEIIDYANRKNMMFSNNLEKQLSGCNFQYYTYEEQLNEKAKMVKSLLDEVIKYPYEFLEPVRNEKELRYRNKMEFSFGNEKKDGEMILGLHKKNSFHDIVDVSNNNLMPECFNKVYMFSNDFFKEVEKKYMISFYHKVSKEGYFRYLVLRNTRYKKQVLVNLVTTSYIDEKLKDKILSEYVEKLLELDLKDYKISGIIHTINNKLSDTVDSEKETILYGERDIEEKIFDLKFKISPYSFFQVNPYTVEKLYGKVLDFLDLKEDNVVYDLFSGTGTIAQIISKKFKKVYAIEIVEEAVNKAIENAKLNNIDNISFLCGDVFEKLNELDRKPDVLILDPPRMGVLTKTIEKLVKYDVENIIYVSCNPVTLASDIKDFQNHSYTVKKAVIVDMFSFTNHVETVVLLSKK